MAKTTTQEMDTLHSQLARTLKEEIESFKVPIEVADEDGKIKKVQRDKKGLAALLNVARQFLKDNDVTAQAVPESPLKSLADSLPFAGEEFSNGDDTPVH